MGANPQDNTVEMALRWRQLLRDGTKTEEDLAAWLDQNAEKFKGNERRQVRFQYALKHGCPPPWEKWY